MRRTLISATTRVAVIRAIFAALVILLGLRPSVFAADDKPAVMKISLATVNDALHQFAREYAAAVERDSGGRIKAEIVCAMTSKYAMALYEQVQLRDVVVSLVLLSVRLVVRKLEDLRDPLADLFVRGPA